MNYKSGHNAESQETKKKREIGRNKLCCQHLCEPDSFTAFVLRKCLWHVVNVQLTISGSNDICLCISAFEAERCSTLSLIDWIVCTFIASALWKMMVLHEVK
jgi:hypothetical protein